MSYIYYGAESLRNLILNEIEKEMKNLQNSISKYSSEIENKNFPFLNEAIKNNEDKKEMLIEIATEIDLDMINTCRKALISKRNDYNHYKNLDVSKLEELSDYYNTVIHA